MSDGDRGEWGISDAQPCPHCARHDADRLSAVRSSVLCDQQLQDALNKVKELTAQLALRKTADDEDYKYRVEQIAGRILAVGIRNWGGERITEKCIEGLCDSGILAARKLVSKVEGMDRDD